MPAADSSDAAAPGRFFDGLTGRARPVGLVVRDGALEVRETGGETGGEALRRWPLAALRRVDAGGPEAALSVRGDAARLFTSDAALLGRLKPRGPRLGGEGWGARRWTAVLGATLAGAALAALLVDRLPSLLTPLVPARVERGWAAGVESVLFVGQRRCDGRDGMAALRGLMDRLSAGAGLGRAPEFEVLDTPLVNAFTLPGGRVVILRGLIGYARDPDELSGVLAHELGHVKRRDPTREALRGTLLGMVGRSLGWGGGLAGDMAALSYGRTAEAAADSSALDTLRAAGLRADGLGRLFARMQGKGGASVPGFLSNHPTTESRAARLRTGPEGEAAVTDEAWAAIRRVCDDDQDHD